MADSVLGRKYGFKKSLVDHRDLGAFRLLAPAPIPPFADLEQWTGAVKDQGQEGSCTAHAGTENLEYLYRRFKNEAPVFSPQFLYYKEREMDGTLPGDNGSFGRTSVRCMNKFGCCLLSQDPYDTGQMDTSPTTDQETEAAAYKAGAYHALASVDEMRHCIASNYPFLVGFNVYQSFEDTQQDGLVPPISGDVLGGHEVLVIGYDDNAARFKLRNSWGESWGDAGNCYMSYNDLLSVFMEAWIQHFGPPWK